MRFGLGRMDESGSCATSHRKEVQIYMTFPTMLTLNQAAEATGLSYDHLRKLCLQRKIVFIRAGSKYLVNAEKLVEYLETGEAVKSGK